MWWFYIFVSILLFSTIPTYSSDSRFYGSSRYGKRTAPVTRREQRSGIFWTGSRYNRRGTDILGMKTRKGSDLFIGSRYGKRTAPEETEPAFYFNPYRFSRIPNCAPACNRKR